MHCSGTVHSYVESNKGRNDQLMLRIRVGVEREKGIQEGRFMDVQALRNKGHEQDQLKDLRQERKRSKEALQQVSVKMDSMEKQMNELAKLL